jgi:transcriptional regulator with GAF, ATPase, and Fis domain
VQFQLTGRDVSARARKAGIPLVGESEQFLQVLQIVERVARHSDVTVLIRGETGTGKELVARATHYLGPRCAFPFVPVNCGTLPESLAENELFGHRTGAFTGARADAVGLVRLAHNGTLFLDEIDALLPKTQVALLRFLQDGHYRPLGAAREEKANVRVIAASNKCLADEVSAGRFRQDLYYRLNLLSIDVPPLRAREGDVRVLAQYFLDLYSQRYALPRRSIHLQTLRWFDCYAWPGNVRELENILHREYLLCDDSTMCIRMPRGAESAGIAVRAAREVDLTQVTYKSAKSRALEEFDRAYLSQLLVQAQGNVTRAAQLAGKERRALGKLLKRYRIPHGNETYDGES